MLLLFLIIAFGATLRFWGISYDLPYAFNSDEAYIMDRAVAVADGNLRHGVIFRGSLPYYITGFTIRLTSLFSPKVKLGFPTFQKSYEHDKTPFYIIGRAIVASYSVLTMITLYLLARALFSEAIGLLSVLIFSLNMLEIQYAHQIYSDTALSFFMLLTLYTLLIAYKLKRQSFFLVSAVLIGLAMGQKLPAIILLPLSILMYRIVLKAQLIPLHTQIARYVLLTGIVIVVYIVSYPFIFSELSTLQYKWHEDTRSNIAQLDILETRYGAKISDYMMWLRQSSGIIVALFTYIGAFKLLRRKKIFPKILLGFVMCFVLFISLVKAHWDNYLLPVLPIISLFATIGLYAWYTWIVASKRSIFIGLIFTGLLLYPGAIKAVWTARSYSQLDTRSQEIQWLNDRHIDNTRIARDGHSGIDVPSDTVLLSNLNHDQLRAFDYFVLSGWYSPNFNNPERHSPHLAQWYADLKNTYTKIAEFSPSDDIISHDDVQIFTSWNWWKESSPVRGPLISIYAVNKH